MNMKCDSQAFLLAYTLASPCLGREPKAKVVTINVTLTFYAITNGSYMHVLI